MTWTLKYAEHGAVEASKHDARTSYELLTQDNRKSMPLGSKLGRYFPLRDLREITNSYNWYMLISVVLWRRCLSVEVSIFFSWWMIIEGFA